MPLRIQNSSIAESMKPALQMPSPSTSPVSTSKHRPCNAPWKICPPTRHRLVSSRHKRIAAHRTHYTRHKRIAAHRTHDRHTRHTIPRHTHIIGTHKTHHGHTQTHHGHKETQAGTHLDAENAKDEQNHDQCGHGGGHHRDTSQEEHHVLIEVRISVKRDLIQSQKSPTVYDIPAP